MKERNASSFVSFMSGLDPSIVKGMLYEMILDMLEKDSTVVKICHI